MCKQRGRQHRHANELARLTPTIDYSALVETTDPTQLTGQLQIPTDGGVR